MCGASAVSLAEDTPLWRLINARPYPQDSMGFGVVERMMPSRLFLFCIAIVLGITVSPVCVVAETPPTDAVSDDSHTAEMALARVDKLSQQVEKLREAYAQVPKIDQALFIELVFTLQTELRKELDRLIKILGER